MIGDELGWKRWRPCCSEAEQLGSLRYRTKKSTLPPYLDVGYRRHEQWNVRTLTLLAQAGDHPAPTRHVSNSDAERRRGSAKPSTRLLQRGRQVHRVRIRRRRIQASRAGSRHWPTSGRGVDTRRRRPAVAADARQGQECVGRTIARHYQVRFGDGAAGDQPGLPWLSGLSPRARDVAGHPSRSSPGRCCPRREAGRDPLAGVAGQARRRCSSGTPRVRT